MRRSRFLPYGIAILVVFGLVSGCSRGPSEEELAKAAFEEQLASLQLQYEELQQARTDLAASEATLAEIEAIRERDRSEEQIAELEALPAAIVELGTAMPRTTQYRRPWPISSILPSTTFRSTRQLCKA